MSGLRLGISLIRYRIKQADNKKEFSALLALRLPYMEDFNGIVCQPVSYSLFCFHWIFMNKYFNLLIGGCLQVLVDVQLFYNFHCSF
jgi:hypothetical protein